MQERYIRRWTPHLSRDFEMLAFGPGGGLPLVIFPTSFGRYYQIKDFGLIDAVASFVDSGRFTIYCPDAIDLDSFYNKSIHPADRMRTHLAYENVVVRDVFDLARRECSTHRVALWHSDQRRHWGVKRGRPEDTSVGEVAADDECATLLQPARIGPLIA